MKSGITRAAYLLYSGVFLFFLFYSTPHRIHHFFDSYRQAQRSTKADDHRGNKPHNPAPKGSNCVFQAAANGCLLILTTLVQIFSPSNAFANPPSFSDSNIPQESLFHPFHIRAPPQT